MKRAGHKQAVGVNKSYNLFANRYMAIATMHHKEWVMAPLLAEAIQVKCRVPKINTDLHGTFSGEIERKQSPIEAARKKCNAAIALTGYDLAIASEGSFGQHPSIPFTVADDEVVLLVDKKNNFEIWGRAISSETNFGGKLVETYPDALQYARKVGFPFHALIIKEQQFNFQEIHKGINSVKSFKSIVNNMLLSHNNIWIETDMRALHNPKRMNVIQSATENLIAKLNSHCPSCYFPGYWVQEAISGLPCLQCGFPTRSTLAFMHGCINCDHKTEQKFPHHKTAEDPTYCDRCNP